MSTFQNFEEIEAWQKARLLTKEIYRISKKGPFSRDYGLCDQIRRSSTSIMANIAEGFERSGTGEFLQFLSIAKGSAGEVKSHLYVALDQEYLDEATFNRLYEVSAEVNKMIGGLMNYLRTSKLKGVKYKK